MKSKLNQLPNGVYAASLTPLSENQNIHTAEMYAHCKWLLDNGCAGLVIFGTTGEANSFSVAERVNALEKLLESGLTPETLMIGTGSCSISDTITLTKNAVTLGAGAVLILPPFYYKGVTDEGLFNYYAEVIKKVGSEKISVYLYHIPQITGIAISHTLIEKLIHHFPNDIVGIKDSSGDWQNTAELLRRFPEFRVFAGSEKFLLENLQLNGPGCISASTNIICARAHELYAKWDQPDAESIQGKLTEFRLKLERFPMIPALKHIKYRSTGNIVWQNVRPPLVPLNKEQKKTVDHLIEEYVLI